MNELSSSKALIEDVLDLIRETWEIEYHKRNHSIMKAITPVMMVLGLIGVATVLAQTTPNNQKATEALENRIKALEARVATLEMLNAKTIGQRNVVFVPSVTNFAPAPSVEVQPVPNPHWKPFEFNNETYYFVPLGLSAGNKN